MRDRDLVRLHWPAELRPAFDALFALDDAMGAIVARSAQPALGAIKLAWWREALAELDSGPPPAEPRLRAAADHLLPAGITGEELSGIEPGWATLLEERPDHARIAQRGSTLFLLAGRLLGATPEGLGNAGALFATVDLGRRTWQTHWLTNAEDLRALRFPRRVRPVTGLAALASRDLRRHRRHGWEEEGTPGRAWTLLAHRLTGRVA